MTQERRQEADNLTVFDGIRNQQSHDGQKRGLCPFSQGGLSQPRATSPTPKKERTTLTTP